MTDKETLEEKIARLNGLKVSTFMSLHRQSDNAERNMEEYNNVMLKDKILEELNKGKVLIMDGWATENEREIVSQLINKNLAKSEFIEQDQYSYYRITKP